ncbi:MAG: hypothetical protein AB7Q01_15245 [Gammaproteobacteria bacterium]
MSVVVGRVGDESGDVNARSAWAASHPAKSSALPIADSAQPASCSTSDGVAAVTASERILPMSVFQCRLNPLRHAEMIAALDALIQHKEDALLVIDLELASSVQPRVVALGEAFKLPERAPTIV